MSTINVGGPENMLELRGMPDILLQYPEGLTESLRDELLNDLDGLGDKVIVESQPPVLWASLKIAMIGLIVVFIAEAYIAGFVAEAGKDHYQVFKRWLSKVARTAKRIPSRTITASASVEKIDPSDSASASLSIFFMTKLGISVKLVYNDNMSAERWGELTAQFVDLIKEHYENHPDDQLTQSIHALTDDHYPTAFVVMDEQTGGWVIGTWRDFYKRNSTSAENAPEATQPNDEAN